VLAQLVNHHSSSAGALRYRQIEYYRMPMMAYLAVDDPLRLTRSDFIRLGLVTGGGDTVPGSEATLPYGEQHLADFEQHFCYDRFWSHSGAAAHTRYLCSSLAESQDLTPLPRPPLSRLRYATAATTTWSQPAAAGLCRVAELHLHADAGELPRAAAGRPLTAW